MRNVLESGMKRKRRGWVREQKDSIQVVQNLSYMSFRKKRK